MALLVHATIEGCSYSLFGPNLRIDLQQHYGDIILALKARDA